jgi:hypothetical protein
MKTMTMLAIRLVGALSLGLMAACEQPGDDVPTHALKFWDYGGAVTRVEETMDADLDRDAPLTLNKMVAGHRTLADIYQIFAAEKGDRSVVDRLRGIDDRLDRLEAVARAELKQSLPLAAARGDEGTSPVPMQPAARVATPVELPEGIEARQGAAGCGEPAWDWDAEAVWYADNFCQGSPDMCRVNKLGWLSWGWDWWIKRFQVTVMNQSHCSQAHWILQWRNHAGAPSYGITESTPTNTLMWHRLIHTDVWSGGNNVEYYTKMARTQTGSRVAMTIYVTYK